MRQPFVGLLQLDLQAPQGQVGLDAGQDLFQPEGLGDVIHPTQREGLDLVFDLVEGADEDDRQRRQVRQAVEPGAHLVAVQVGHVDVEQDQVGWGGAGPHQGQPAVGGRAHFIALVGQHTG